MTGAAAASTTTVRVASAVAPLGLVATMFRNERPPISGTSNEKDPSGAAVPVTTVVFESSSTFVAAIRIVLPGADVPLTVTGLVTIVRSTGVATVSVVWPCAWRT